MSCDAFVKRLIIFGGSAKAHAAPPVQIALLPVTRSFIEQISLKLPPGTKYVVAYTQMFIAVGKDDHYREVPVGQPFDTTGRLYLEGKMTTLGESNVRKHLRGDYKGLCPGDDLPDNMPVLVFPSDGEFELCPNGYKPKFLAA